eukprot:217651-Amphidinium_carterae.3
MANHVMPPCTRLHLQWPLESLKTRVPSQRHGSRFYSEATFLAGDNRARGSLDGSTRARSAERTVPHVVQLQQQLAAQQQQQAVHVPVPSGHIKLDSKLGRPPLLAGDGKNWEEFAFKLAAHTDTATLSNIVSAFLPSIEKKSEDQRWQ